MVLHGELARRRPAARHLTRFYLMLSLGGALGGVAGRPGGAAVLLPAYYELGIGSGAAGAARLRAVAPAAGAAWRCARCWLALCGALPGAAGASTTRPVRAVLSRNFYGTLSTYDATRDDPRSTSVRQMYHGAVKHGEQYLAAERRREPTTYYGATSGIGRAILSAPRRPRRSA